MSTTNTKTTKKATTAKVTSADTEPKLQSCLLDKKVKLRLIPRNKNKLTNNISEATAFTYTNHSVILPKYASTGKYPNPLTWEEQQFLEHRLGVSLDNARETDNYWDKIRVTFRKDSQNLEDNSVELDLSDPYMYLQYKMLLIAPEVANDAVSEFLPDQKFFIEDSTVDDVRRYTLEEDMDKATEFKISLKGNKKGLFDFLRVYSWANKGVKVSRKDSVEFLYNKLGSLIRDSRTLPKVLDILEHRDKDEAYYNLNLMIIDGIEIGEIINSSKGFEAANGTFIGSDLSESVVFFKNPANTSLKQRIRQQLELQLN